MKNQVYILFLLNLVVFHTSLSVLLYHKDGKSYERTTNQKSDDIRATASSLAWDEEILLRRLIDRLMTDNLVSDPEKLTTDRRLQHQTRNTNLGLGEGYIFDHPENIPADSSLENILEGEVIEEGKHTHQAQGTKPEMKKKLKGEMEDGHLTLDFDERKRNFMRNTGKYWTKGIVPFEIDPAFDPAKVKVIYSAIEQFDNLTCVRWISRDDPRYTHDNLGHIGYVKFVNGSGCSSYVGNVVKYLSRYNYEYQPISLNIPGCVSRSIAVHEMLHAMAARHEQSRSDRDDYLEIQFQNMDPSKRANFNKQKTTDFHPFDGSSVLQYSLRAFSSTGGQTIRFKNHALEFLANIANGLMFYDVMDVNSAYNCAENCPPKKCQNAGFVNWKCECYCPDLLTGPLCEQIVESQNGCGGILNVPAGQDVYITTPHYPNNYDTGINCTWLIQGEPNNILRGTIVDMDINNNHIACYHWVEIRANLLGQVGPKRCGKTTNEVWDASPDEFKNKMIIRFDSFIGSDEPASRGFRMKFESIGTGCLSNPCQFGSCYSPVNTDTYVCTCDTGFTGINCTEVTDSAVVGCTAEYGEYCVLKQDEENDDFDFDYTGQGTPSLYTGPKNAIQGYVYMYTEAGRRSVGDRAVLYTDINLPSVNRCLRFFYHMYGSDMGTLNVYKEDSNGRETRIFSKTGQLWNRWIDAAIFIPAMDGLKIKFESIIGGGRSDMAIDDVLLEPADRCEIDQTSIQSMTCDFETDEDRCLFRNVIDNEIDIFDWKRKTGSTPTSDTGPSNAFTGQYYMFIDSSSPRRSGDKAVLTTYRYQLPGGLNVSAGERGGDLNGLLSMSGNKGNQWKTTQITIPQYSDAVINITGIRGNNDKGDIAVDNIQLTIGNCNPCAISPCENNGQCSESIDDGTFICTCSSGFAGRLCNLHDRRSDTTFRCDFEDNENGCVLSNAGNDVFDWTRKSGGTPTHNTGPGGAISGRNYMYIETSAPRKPGDNAILDTSEFKLAENSPFCMQYKYHMYGNPGDLIVAAGERGTTPTEIKKLSGNKAERWHTSTVQIPSNLDTVISIEATRGSAYTGDIAVDSIIIQEGLCTDSCGGFPCFNDGNCTNDGATLTHKCSCFAGYLGQNCEVLDQTQQTEFTCGFEDTNEQCVFQESKNDDFDWTRRRGTTPSSWTGPPAAYKGSYYKYTEASSPRVTGDYAILDTSQNKLADSTFCLKFAYHMYGSPGSLIIAAGERNGDLKHIFTLKGSQGNQWLETSVDIAAFNDVIISVKGTRGSQFTGDIAIDDIRLKVGTCIPV